MKNCNPINILGEFSLKLSRAGIGDMVDNTHYRKIVGSLMYLTATRSKIMYVVSLFKQYMKSPTNVHLLYAKIILCYLQVSKDFGLIYEQSEKLDLLVFVDNYYVGDQNHS